LFFAARNRFDKPPRLSIPCGSGKDLTGYCSCTTPFKSLNSGIYAQPRRR